MRKGSILSRVLGLVVACLIVGSVFSGLVETAGAASPPAVAPTHIAPSNGATGISLTPTFQWGAVAGATKYGLYISKPPYGAANLVYENENITVTSLPLPGGILSEGVTYRWNMRAGNAAGWGPFSTAWSFTTLTTERWLSLGEAIDNIELSWTTGGTADWFGQKSTFYYGSDAAQSGAITHNQLSWLRTTVTGPGTLGFYWKVSSESGYDYLGFYIDGSEQVRISGFIDWQQRSYSIGSGTHTLEWKYVKDSSVNMGSDCGWVDKVEFIPNRPPSLAGLGQFRADGTTPMAEGEALPRAPWSSRGR